QASRSMMALLGTACGYGMYVADLESRSRLKMFLMGSKVPAVASDETCLPVGQMKLHAPQVQQTELCLPKGACSFFFGPLPVKPMAALPMRSSHMRTHRPQ